MISLDFVFSGKKTLKKKCNVMLLAANPWTVRNKLI